MLFTLLSILLINISLSLDNIIPILSLITNLATRKEKLFALLIGLLLGAAFRLFFLSIATILTSFGNYFYFISGLLLFYIGISNLVKIQKKKDKKIPESTRLLEIIGFIALLDVTLSLDNTVALIGVTTDFFLLTIGTIISIFIMVGISFSIEMLLKKIKGLQEAAFISILYLAMKFLLIPFHIVIPDAASSITISLIFFITILYHQKGKLQQVLRRKQ